MKFIKKLRVDLLLTDVCHEILVENKSLNEWAEVESCGWFQNEKYCGGFDETEMMFCFSYFEDEFEYFFQFSLDKVQSILNGAIQYVDLYGDEGIKEYTTFELLTVIYICDTNSTDRDDEAFYNEVNAELSRRGLLYPLRTAFRLCLYTGLWFDILPSCYGYSYKDFVSGTIANIVILTPFLIAFCIRMYLANLPYKYFGYTLGTSIILALFWSIFLHIFYGFHKLLR